MLAFDKNYKLVTFSKKDKSPEALLNKAQDIKNKTYLYKGKNNFAKKLYKTGLVGKDVIGINKEIDGFDDRGVIRKLLDIVPLKRAQKLEKMAAKLKNTEKNAKPQIPQDFVKTKKSKKDDQKKK